MTDLTKINCAGVIVFNRKNINNIQCAIIVSHNNNTKNYKTDYGGFPKGKRERIKYKENIIGTAKRELFEESGIEFSSLRFVKDVILNEYSTKGVLSIIYLVAEYISPVEHIFTYDASEIKSSGWISLINIKDILDTERTNILNCAIKEIKNLNVVFVTETYFNYKHGENLFN